MRAATPRLRPAPVLQWAAVRLRPLTEAECYARCYGGRRGDSVSVVAASAPEPAGREHDPEPYEGADALERRESA